MSFIMPGFWYTLRVLLHQVFIVQSLKSWVWLWLFRGKTGTNVQFIHLHSCTPKAGRSIHWLCALQLHNALQHNYISPTSVILALLCDIFQSTQREVHWWEYSRDLFEAVQNTHSTTCLNVTWSFLLNDFLRVYLSRAMVDEKTDHGITRTLCYDQHRVCATQHSLHFWGYRNKSL